jgi:glyoxylase-like metal-dependent hydrolase (beta-lactamase superfamily II)
VFAPAQTGASLDELVTDVVEDEHEVVPGIVALVTGSPAPNEECVYVIPHRGAAVVGDVLLGDAGGGLRVADASWYDNSDTERAWYRGRLADSLERLLAYDLRQVFPGHGAPVAPDPADTLRAALARHRATPYS